MSELRYIISNPAYIGRLVVGRCSSQGEFASMTPGEKVAVFQRIIDQQTWEIVQEKIKRRFRATRSVPRGNNTSPLQGVVWCGKCGSRMAREQRASRKGDKVYSRYRCYSPEQRPGKKCKCWGVSDSELIPRIIQELLRRVDLELLKRLQAKPEAEAISDLDILHQKAGQLQKKIAVASDRYLTAPANMMPALAEKLTGYQTQLDEVENQINILAASRNATGLGGLLKWWEGIKEKVLVLSPDVLPNKANTITPKDIISSALEVLPEEEAQTMFNGAADRLLLFAEADKFREFCHQVGLKVTLFFKPRPFSKKWARHTRRQESARFYLPDWERSTISVNFRWSGERTVNTIDR